MPPLLLRAVGASHPSRGGGRGEVRHRCPAFAEGRRETYGGRGGVPGPEQRLSGFTPEANTVHWSVPSQNPAPNTPPPACVLEREGEGDCGLAEQQAFCPVFGNPIKPH